MNRNLSLMLFLALTLGGGLVLGSSRRRANGMVTLPSQLSTRHWLFGPVWTVLYIFIAIAGWRVWQRDRTA